MVVVVEEDYLVPFSFFAYFSLWLLPSIPPAKWASHFRIVEMKIEGGEVEKN